MFETLHFTNTKYKKVYRFKIKYVYLFQNKSSKIIVFKTTDFKINIQKLRKSTKLIYKSKKETS